MNDARIFFLVVSSCCSVAFVDVNVVVLLHIYKLYSIYLLSHHVVLETSLPSFALVRHGLCLATSVQNVDATRKLVASACRVVV